MFYFDDELFLNQVLYFVDELFLNQEFHFAIAARVEFATGVRYRDSPPGFATWVRYRGSLPGFATGVRCAGQVKRVLKITN